MVRNGKPGTIERALAGRLRGQRRRRFPEQDDVQRPLFQWAKLVRIQDPPDPVRRFLADWMFHIPNERTSRLERKILAGLGVLPGVSDVCLALPRGRYFGLWLELKAAGGTLTDNQRAFLISMIRAGYQAKCAIGIDAARGIILDYLQGGPFQCDI